MCKVVEERREGRYEDEEDLCGVWCRRIGERRRGIDWRGVTET